MVQSRPSRRDEGFHGISGTHLAPYQQRGCAGAACTKCHKKWRYYRAKLPELNRKTSPKQVQHVLTTDKQHKQTPEQHVLFLEPATQHTRLCLEPRCCQHLLQHNRPRSPRRDRQQYGKTCTASTAINAGWCATGSGIQATQKSTVGVQASKKVMHPLVAATARHH